ncbi:MAG TPA: cache domain-containing protein [Pseudolabrys sp.]|nr:cache domain-containing protein [Pseudolabrys sp.]
MHSPQTHLAPRRTIRFWLNCLVVACVLPAVVVATFIIARSFNQERAGLERDLIGTARALSQAVDAELGGARSALLILATSPHLASRDLTKFYDEAQQVVRAINVNNILLTDKNGQQLINTLRPLGTALPLHGNLENFRRVIDGGETIVSNLFIGAVTKKPIIAVEAPVFSNGEPIYGIAIGIVPERLNEILRRQNMPANWVAGIVDTSDTIVARTVGGDEVIGKKISPDLKQALMKAREGAFEGTTLEGIAVLTSFSRSALSGWTVAIGIPKEGMFSFLWQALLGNVAAAVVLLAAGIMLARLISARIANSIRALREPAIGLGAPGPVAVPAVNIQEVHELGQSLVAAQRLIDQRTAERNDLRRRLMKAQEEERLRLARDLHDQTGQSVTAAILDLKGIESLVQEKDRDRVRTLRAQLDGIGQVLHRIAWELRPASIDELGLTNALENYLGEWSTKHVITVDFHCADANLDKRSDEIRTAIYRVIQEALTNIAKHANNATRVSIGIVTSDDMLHLTIENNGRGFNPAAYSSRLGLAGMRERMLLVGGELEIESSPDNGTTIFARIPLLTERTAA